MVAALSCKRRASLPHISPCRENEAELMPNRAERGVAHAEPTGRWAQAPRAEEAPKAYWPRQLSPSPFPGVKELTGSFRKEAGWLLLLE